MTIWNSDRQLLSFLNLKILGGESFRSAHKTRASDPPLVSFIYVLIYFLKFDYYNKSKYTNNQKQIGLLIFNVILRGIFYISYVHTM